VVPQRWPHSVIPTDHPTEGRPPVSRMIEARNPIGELVTGRQWDQLRDALRPMHPSDIADVIIEQPTETEGIIFRLLPREKAARAFAYLPLAEQRHLLDSLSNEQVRHLLDEMSPDDRTHLLEEMPAEVTRELLLQLDPQELQAARQDRKSTRLNSSHVAISYAVFCLKKKNQVHKE